MIRSRFRLRIVPLLVMVGLIGAPADAKLCGDDVNGQDVPCECGDTVVSDLTLADDPVASSPCESDGLIVQAAAASKGVTIDLSGKTLRGTGRGTGVWILSGGSGGAKLVSNGARATIVGFHDGVIGHGEDSVALIENLLVRESVRDGVRVGAAGHTIRDAEVQRAGRDGFSISGADFRLSHTRAVDSGRFGYLVMGREGTVGFAGAGNVAEKSGNAGFNLMGTGHRLVDCLATRNNKAGLNLQGMNLDIRSCRAEDNQGDGIVGTGSDWYIANNQAVNNGGDGIVVRGPQLVDEGGNGGSGNRGLGEQRAPIQCSINGAPCAS